MWRVATIFKAFACLSLWMVGMYAVLQVGRLETPWDHVVCGAWGCGPSLPALAAFHLFWLALLAPPALVGGAWLTPRRRAQAALGLIAVGVGGVAWVVAHECRTWLPMIGPGEPTYFVQRCLFAVATWVDAPLAQLVMIGLTLWLWPAGSTRKDLPAASRRASPFAPMDESRPASETAVGVAERPS